MFALLLLAAGCYRSPDAAPPRTPETTTPGTSAAAAPSPKARPVTTSPTVRRPAPTVGKPAPTGSPYRVRYGWAIPSAPARVAHAVRPPIAPPPAPALPYLVEMNAADHPEGEPGYSRFSFYFRGAFPGYEFQYVPRVTHDGSGRPVELTGNSFLRLRFTPAQAHDGNGRSSIERAPNRQLGFPTLRSYGQAGDYEGYLTYGFGIQVAPGGDQVMPIRIGEMIRPDGLHVVAVDVRRG
ncbi:hypothetical protein SAMN05444365_107164 [Micromonospora pattaloongensis]|uniref:AMIN-like domain-containing protein n=1 Tax=Micromonospora pattaloongensis TaxID=405436 RepID=A0A1H3R9R9_9ACTN|nr:hypothetical protein [Micromonospora pattaloongensis]SDZ22380.1 hypothetical protein SAMN05444365_107164 [Micromonospora pattaloongensis]